MFSMANYYYLVTSVPPLSLEVPPEISFSSLKEMLVLNLTSQDLRKVKRLLWHVDLMNIRALWLGLPLDERGNYSAKELEEELLVRESLPGYLIQFLDQYETKEDRLRHFSSLFASLFRSEASKAGGFIAKNMKFERELRLVLTALRAKRQGRDLIRELQFEDPTDPFIAAILAQKDAQEYFPPQEYEVVKTLFLSHVSEPAELNLAILRYKFDTIEEWEENQGFGIDRVLSYIVRLMIVESLEELSKEQGKLAVEQLSQYE